MKPGTETKYPFERNLGGGGNNDKESRILEMGCKRVRDLTRWTEVAILWLCALAHSVTESIVVE